MPDYVAVLNKTISGLADNNEEIRAKVYERARTTIRKQLESVSPALPIERISAETDNLEQAINEVEAQYAPASASEVAEVDLDLGDALLDSPSSEAIAETTPSVSVETPASVEPAVASASSSSFEANVSNSHGEFSAPDLGGAPASGVAPVPPKGTANQEPKRKGGKGWIALLVILLAGGGGLYALSQSQNELTDKLRQYSKALNLPFFQDETQDAVSDEATSGGDGSTDAGATATSSDSSGDDLDPKFNERLGSNGETTQAEPRDVTPSSSTDTTTQPAPVETDTAVPDSSSDEQSGQIVVDDNGVQFALPGSEGTNEDAVEPQTAPSDNGQAENTAAPTTDSSAADPIVAQRSCFYGESSAGHSTSRTAGSTSWSNGDREGVPTIEAQAELKDLGMNVSMVIRKYTVESLSASHVIELLFTVPDDFVGRSIDNVRQVVLKDTEEAQGNALIAEPAKISEGFFLIALYDLPEARTANEQILQARNWIDIPVAYATGRRALLTLEKGAKGNSVFQSAFAAWAQ